MEILGRFRIIQKFAYRSIIYLGLGDFLAAYNVARQTSFGLVLARTKATHPTTCSHALRWARYYGPPRSRYAVA